MPEARPDSNLSKAVWLVALIGIGTVLYLGQDIFIPVAMALFLALLLTPAVDRLQRWGLRRGLAVIVVMFVVIASVASALNAAWAPATEWLTRAPQTMRKIDPRLQPLRDVFARVDAVAERAGRLTQASPPTAGKPAVVAEVDNGNVAITLTKSFLESLTVVPLTLFFLLGGPPLLARMGASLSGNEASVRTLRLTEAIRYEVGRYFGTIALINVGLGVCTALAMYALAMPNAILWGVLAALFNFVPYLGPIAAFFILSVAALVTFENLGHALAVPGVFLCLHLIEGQIVQPLTVGRRFEVNALVVLLAVWFGYGLWGIPGMLLAMPSVVAARVAAQYLPQWRTVRDFLSPNEYWHPRSLKRMRVPRAGAEDSVVTRASQ
ncbi:MAG TPA: AI-2E family transporter [Steroidobacteraceae bacterium]|jgi:predicted PurR-regulated permease PerM|nr:AI-2E family transporter [Steroidobacteraceae bacterium]